jgi:hypothetical protein
MKYLLLIYADEAIESSMNADKRKQLHADYFGFTKELQGAGAMQGGEALHPVATATTVRVRDGKMLTTDGPFAETKEQLGGFYLIDGKNLDEAIQWAAKIPGAKVGSIEVRPVVDFSKTGM